MQLSMLAGRLPSGGRPLSRVARHARACFAHEAAAAIQRRSAHQRNWRTTRAAALTIFLSDESRDARGEHERGGGVRRIIEDGLLSSAANLEGAQKRHSASSAAAVSKVPEVVVRLLHVTNDRTRARPGWLLLPSSTAARSCACCAGCGAVDRRPLCRYAATPFCHYAVLPLRRKVRSVWPTHVCAHRPAQTGCAVHRPSGRRTSTASDRGCARALAAGSHSRRDARPLASALVAPTWMALSVARCISVPLRCTA